MSYILEAIKRSEQQRRNSGKSASRAAPLFADGETVSPWPLYGAASAILIVAGITIGWLRPWQHGDAAGASVPIASRPAESAPGQISPVQSSPPLPGATLEPASPGPDALPAVKVEELQVMKMKPYAPRVPAQAHTQPAARATPDAAPAAAPPVAVAQAAAPAAPTVTGPAVPATPATGAASPEARDGTPAPAAAAADVSHAPAEDRILSLYELPPAVLHEIPQMSISGYSYSGTAKDRVVGINDRLFQEGQYVADGLKLEQITPDGLIFTYRRYRFRKSL